MPYGLDAILKEMIDTRPEFIDIVWDHWNPDFVKQEYDSKLEKGAPFSLLYGTYFFKRGRLSLLNNRAYFDSNGEPITRKEFYELQTTERVS
jgi:hypothetical protein